MPEASEATSVMRAASVELAGFEASSPEGPLAPAVSLSLVRGEGVVLSGPMGAGKSVLCEYLAGIRRPGVRYVGSLEFLDAAGTPVRARAALAPQDWRLAALRTDRVRLLTATREPAVSEFLEMFEVQTDRLQNLELYALSASERTRVLLACALAEGPDLLVLDGPADVLDARQRRLVSTAVEAAISRGTMLIVSGRDGALWLPADFRRVEIGEPVGQEAVAVPLMQKRKEPERAVAKPPALDVGDVDIEHRQHGHFFEELFSRAKPTLVVDGASLFVRTSEILVLLGPSGSGKSTLLAAMAGHLPPQAGRVRVSGVDVTSGRGRQVRALRDGVRLVSMDGFRTLDPARTVAEHIESAAPKAARTATTGPIVATWLDRLGLKQQLAGLAIDCLSEAESFRLALGLALCADPRVVLLDTPRSGALDADGGILTGLLLAEKAQGRSFVLATSDPGISRSLADRIAILDAGRVLEFGPTSLVLGKPAHPRTLGLLSSAPGPVHDPRAPHPACHLSGACPRELERCSSERPALDFVPGTTRNHRVACFNPSLERIS